MCCWRLPQFSGPPFQIPGYWTSTENTNIRVTFVKAELSPNREKINVAKVLEAAWFYTLFERSQQGGSSGGERVPLRQPHTWTRTSPQKKTSWLMIDPSPTLTWSMWSHALIGVNYLCLNHDGWDFQATISWNDEPEKIVGRISFQSQWYTKAVQIVQRWGMRNSWKTLNRLKWIAQGVYTWRQSWDFEMISSTKALVGLVYWSVNTPESPNSSCTSALLYRAYMTTGTRTLSLHVRRRNLRLIKDHWLPRCKTHNKARTCTLIASFEYTIHWATEGNCPNEKVSR